MKYTVISLTLLAALARFSNCAPGGSSALLYLSQYGYLGSSTRSMNNSSALQDESVFRKAVEDFQNFAGLDVTGELDDATVKVMQLPRCGVKDKVGTGDNRAKRYALQGSRWKVKDLKYKISKYPKNLNTREVDKEIHRAFSVWSGYTDLTFTPSKGSAHIDIRFESGEHGDGDPFDGPGGTLAHAYFPVFGGDAHFDASEKWTINSYRGTNLFQVAAHEFGHSLGLSHSDVREALMAPFYRGYDPLFTLHEDDVLGIQALYGKKTRKTSGGSDDSDFEGSNTPSHRVPAPEPSGPVDTNLCKDPKIDTIFNSAEGYTYIFKGDKYWKLTDESVAPGYPKLISNGWPGLSGNIDAAFTYKNGKTYFFKGSKYWSFSFIRLMDKDGAAVQDGQHELYIYKCEDAQKLENCGYLSLPAYSKDIEGNHDCISQFSRSHKELVFVRTLLCSTKLTQNVDLLALLRWKSHPEKIQDSLQRVLRLGDEELVKFLQDVLDALFALFSTEDGNSTAHSGLVFHVLVSIFNLLDGSKYQHFKPVLDAYIRNHFAAALVYKGLLTSVQHCADWVLSFEKQEPIQKCYKSLEYIFKLIIQSRLLFSRATCGQYEDSFRRDLYSVFSSLNKMLTVNDPHIINTQVALLLSISAVYEQLTEVLPTIEVTKLAATLLDAIPKQLPTLIVQAKLSCIKNLVTSKLFQDDESRNILLVNACKHLRNQLHTREELKLCTEILGEILSFLFKQRRQFDGQGKINNCIHHDVETLCINTLDILVQAVLSIIDRDTKILGCLVSCLIGILQLLDEFHYKRLWEVLMGPNLDRKPLKDFLLRTFLVFRNLVKLEVFPPDWLVIKMVVNNVMLKALQELAQPLAFKFLDSRSGYFDKELWTDYFNLAVDYLTQKPLQLEHFSEVKREKIIEKYGDMRVLMGFQILSMWSQLGECKLHFIPSMVGPFLKVTLVPEIELRKATLHIFFDMMECEQRARGNFRQVESELIDKLDILISENKGDDEYRRLFNTILLDRVQSEDLAWKESGAAFISSITRLLERLLDYRSVIEGDENRDKRMSCTFNLLNFYKNEFNRKEMYLRYIYKLHDLHLSAENYTEAAFTMKLYADQLTWSSTTVIADAHFPNFTECQVKEKLYRQIINYFDKGKCWEKGIPLLKELATLYETQFFDYKALSDILKYQAKFYDNILTQLRPEPEYFRVGFYGLSFPLFVRNKQFVYRGLEYERIGAFTQRLQTEFPSAQILMKNTPPDDSIINSEGQYIQICNVKPIPESNPITMAIDIPDKISRFYHYNDVKRFQCDRPVHKGIIDKENEIKTLWIERMILEIENPLPGILRWFEVINRQTEEIPPVRYACETMQSVELELRQLVTTYTVEPKRNLNPFTMRLQGIIDANVQGGISKYQQAFFTQEFAKLCPEHMTHVYTLKNLILDAMHVIEEGLDLHGRLAPAGVLPLHQRLLERFAQLKESLGSLSKIKRQIPESIVNTPLPPLPIDKRLMVVENGNHRVNSSGTYDYLSEHRTLETDDIYTKPMENERTYPNRENLTLPMTNTTAPPIPQRELRPRSQGFNTSFTEAQTPTRGLEYNTSSLPLMKSRTSDSYDIPLPPKPTHSRERSLTKPPSPRLLRHASMTPTDGTSPLRNSWSDSGVEEAPPLPPRSHTPDKRLVGFSIEAPPNIPKRGQKKSTSSLVGPEGFAALDCGYELTPDSLRDSGISMSENSNMNNLNNTCYEDFDLKSHQQEMNISSSPFEDSPKIENPPPIPPKSSLACSSSLNSSLELTGSLERKREVDDATPESEKEEKSPS